MSTPTGQSFFVHIFGQHNADRDLPVVRGVGRVERAAPGVEAHLTAEAAAELASEPLRIDVEGDRSLAEVGRVDHARRVDSR